MLRVVRVNQVDWHGMLTLSGIVEPEGGSLVNTVGLTGLPGGGVQATVNYSGEFGFGFDGTALFARSTGLPLPSADAGFWYDRPHARVSRPIGSMVPTVGELILLERFGHPGIGESTRSYLRNTAPGTVRRSSRPIEDTMPVVFADRGIVVWMPAGGVLVSSCLADGRTRWAVEWDPGPPLDYPSGGYAMIGLDDGSVVADLGIVTRVSDAGEIMATRYPEPTPRPPMTPYPTTPLWIHPRCGVFLDGSDGDPAAGGNEFYEWWSLDDFSTIAHVSARPPIPSGYVEGNTHDDPIETSDCRIIYRDVILRNPHDPTDLPLERLLSFGQTADMTWAHRSTVGGFANRGLIATDDGGFLVVGSVASSPFGVTLTRADASGTALWSRQYSATDVGAEAVDGANVLMPDGVLWFATTNEFTDGDWLFVAVETGTRPAWFTGIGGAGGNWARTNAPLAAAPSVDAGVLDAGFVDGGSAEDASDAADSGP